MHRLRRLRAGVPGRRHQARHKDEPDGKWLHVNATYAQVWPNITHKKDAPPDAEKFERETGKFEKYFSEKPGGGN